MDLETSDGPAVINFKHYKSVDALNEAYGDKWLYIGRRASRYKLSESPLANQFTVKAHGRAGAIERYRAWLYDRIEAGDADILRALQAIDRDTVLVCWCKPEACHGDVIAAAVASQ